MYIGKTKILLHNVNTGRNEKIEHSNVFKATNIQNYMRTLGYYASHFTSNVPLWQLVTGGILLFDSEIPVNSNIIPAGHGMTANGAYNVTNNSTPVELGTWNDLESSVSSDGNTITMVYDWDTSHGNGEIGSICLTSYEAGVKGIGNPSGEYVNKAIATRQYSNSITDYKCMGDLRISQNVSIADGKITLNCNQIWGETALLTNPSYTVDVALANNPDRVVSAVLLMSGRYTLLLIRSTDSNALGNFSNGATIYVDEIDIRTMTARARNVVNTTGKTIGGGNYAHQGYLPLNENELILTNRTDTTGHYVVNLNTGTFTQFGAGLSRIPNDYNVGDVINENIAIMSASWFNLGAGSCVYDKLNGTVRRQNSATTRFRGGGLYNADIGAMLTGNGCLENNPYYLATINNLEETVTKDVSKTMKVIYTLTKAS